MFMHKKKLTMERVDRFETPNLPEEDAGTVKYALQCVTPQGQRVQRSCTKKAYTEFLRFRPDMKTKCTFMLKYDGEGLVHDYNEVMRPPVNGLFKQEMEDGRVIGDFDKLVFERKAGEKDYDAVIIPEMVGINTVEALTAALKDVTNLEVDQELLGRYKVHEIAQRAGIESVTVDLKQ